jgi:hypothetical protein
VTLILTVANESGVYQSSDYQLTDLKTGTPISDRAGSKQIQASFQEIQLVLAFTGIATLSSGQRTVDWLADKLKCLPQEVRLQQICDVLAERAGATMRPHGPRGVLEIVAAVAAVGEPFRVAVISNANWRKHPPEAKSDFSIRVETIKKPFKLISGLRDSVAFGDRKRLEAVARKIGRSTEDIGAVLAGINAVSAKRSRGYVSEACWVTSQTRQGEGLRTASQNIGQHVGNVHTIFAGFDLNAWVKKNFKAKPGEEIKMVQSAHVLVGPGGGTHLSPPTGEPRRFTIAGAVGGGELVSPGGVHCGTVTIVQRTCHVEARCNEEVIVPFAEVTFRRSASSAEEFPRPLFPWPRICVPLAIDDVDVPRGWEYVIGHWIQKDAHRIEIQTSSRGLRNLAFLGPDDELVIAAPTETAELGWAGPVDSRSLVLNARVSWRTRLDRTHG